MSQQSVVESLERTSNLPEDNPLTVRECGQVSWRQSADGVSLG